MTLKKTTPSVSPDDEPKPNALIAAYTNAKQKLAHTLQAQSDKYSIRTRKIGLLAFGLIVSAISLGIIKNAFTDTPTTIFEHQKSNLKNSHGFIVEDPLLTKKEYEQIRKLMSRLDSSRRLTRDTSRMK